MDCPQCGATMDLQARASMRPLNMAEAPPLPRWHCITPGCPGLDDS